MKFLLIHSKILLILFVLVFSSGCGILNSGTLHLKYTETRATIDGIPYKNDRELGNLSASIRNVQHPDAYKGWNLNLRLTPSVHYDDTTLVLDQDKYQGSENPNSIAGIRIKRTLVFMNLKLTTHMPYGQIVATAGQGIAAYRAKGGGVNTMRTAQVSKLEIVWIGFLTKRLFIMLGPRWYDDGTESTVFAFRLGYFWDRIQKKSFSLF